MYGPFLYIYIYIFTLSIKVETVAANGDRHIGELVAKAIDKVGPDGAFFISVSYLLNFYNPFLFHYCE